MSIAITNLTELKNRLLEAPDLPVVFEAEGTDVQRGYHITELKHAPVSSIDCGGNITEWDETKVQILDGDGGGKFMSGSKLAGIINQSLSALPNLAIGPLKFEYAPGNGQLNLFANAQLSVKNDRININLTPDYALCKPAAGGCCGPRDMTNSKGGCCS